MIRKKETILVVDDEAPVRKFIRHVLLKEDYVLLESADGEEALALSNRYQGPIHLLLTDVMMPMMNGRELADRLCELRPQIKVLFISAYPGSPDFSEPVLGRQAAILSKPFSATSLSERVRSLLREGGGIDG